MNEWIQITDGMTLIGKQIIYTLRKPVLIVTPSTTYPTKTGLWSNPDDRSDQPTFIRLKHGTVKKGTVSYGTRTVFGEWSSEMHATVSRRNICQCQHKTHKLQPQTALKFRNSPFIPDLSLYTQLQILHVHFLLYSRVSASWIFIYDPSGNNKCDLEVRVAKSYLFQSLSKQKWLPLINVSDEHKKYQSKPNVHTTIIFTRRSSKNAFPSDIKIP